jgi:hypothetical protein
VSQRPGILGVVHFPRSNAIEREHR